MNNTRQGLALLVLLTAGCTPNSDAPATPASTLDAPRPVEVQVATSPATTQTDPGVPVPDEEPSEEVLRKLEFERYAAINEMGGLPVTVTATGKSLTLHPTLHEVRKDSCTPTPQAPAGWYECSLTIKVSLAEDGSDPSEQGERIGVKWDPAGKWVLQ